MGFLTDDPYDRQSFLRDSECMISTSTPRPATATKSDPWADYLDDCSDDCSDDADEARTSWVKTYEGGIKHRKYF